MLTTDKLRVGSEPINTGIYNPYALNLTISNEGDGLFTFSINDAVSSDAFLTVQDAGAVSGSLNIQAGLVKVSAWGYMGGFIVDGPVVRFTNTGQECTPVTVVNPSNNRSGYYSDFVLTEAEWTKLKQLLAQS